MSEAELFGSIAYLALIGFICWLSGSRKCRQRIADLEQQLAEAQKHLVAVLSKKSMVFYIDEDWLAAEEYAKHAAIDRALEKD